MPVGGAHTVAAGVAAADDHHILHGSPDIVAPGVEAADTFVLLLEEIHGKMYSFQLPARNGQVTRDRRASGQHDGMIFTQEVVDAHVDAYIGIAFKDDPF